MFPLVVLTGIFGPEYDTIEFELLFNFQLAFSTRFLMTFNWKRQESLTID